MRKDRINAIIDFLRKLPDTKFDLRTWVKRYEGEGVNRCGTVCCVAGWMPVIFPEDWHYRETEDMVPVLTGADYDTVGQHFADYLGLSYSQAKVVLFTNEYSTDNPTRWDAIDKLKGLLECE